MESRAAELWIENATSDPDQRNTCSTLKFPKQCVHRKQCIHVYGLGHRL
jgi:hypothetical protein